MSTYQITSVSVRSLTKVGVALGGISAFIGSTLVLVFQSLATDGVAGTGPFDVLGITVIGVVVGALQFYVIGVSYNFVSDHVTPVQVSVESTGERDPSSEQSGIARTIGDSDDRSVSN